MAKKEYNPSAEREAQIRKAKGNPNKNVHAKKSGSNYGGYAAAERKIAQKQARKEKVPLPTWMIVVLAVLFVCLLAALILRTTVLKDVLWMTHATSVLLGAVCAFLFYTRRWRSERQPDMVDGTYKFIQIALCVFAILYGGMGIMGLAAVFAA